MMPTKGWGAGLADAEAQLERHRAYLEAHPRSRAGKRRIESAETAVRIAKISTIIRDHARPQAHEAYSRAVALFYEGVAREQRGEGGRPPQPIGRPPTSEARPSSQVSGGRVITTAAQLRAAALELGPLNRTLELLWAERVDARGRAYDAMRALRLVRLTLTEEADASLATSQSDTTEP